MAPAEKFQHFGVWIKKSPYNQICRDNYAIIDKRNSHWSPGMAEIYDTPEALHRIYEDDECITYSDSWCEKHRNNCLLNYDLNMAYFDKIPPRDFEKALSKLINSSKKIHEVFDLNEYKAISGIYIMVLDKYKQVYIGQTTNIKRRVMHHWSRKKEFDRLIFGRVDNSVIPIESFGALDTTRIFVLEVSEWSLDAEEKRMVNKIPNKFKLNRVGAGRPRDFVDMLEVIANSNHRNFKNPEKNNVF